MKRTHLLLLADANSVHTLKWVEYLLKTAKYEIAVFSLNSTILSFYRQNNIQVVSVFNSDKLQRNSSGIRKLYYLKALPKLKKFIRNFQPHLLHAHYASSYGLLGKLSGFHPFMISVWGSDVFDFPHKSAFHKFILRQNFKSADIIAATSETLASETSLYTNKSVIVTPFGIDTEKFFPFRSTTSGQKSEFLIGTVKTLESIYGIDYLIKAFALVKNNHPEKTIKLQIVGSGSEEENLKNICNTLNINENVIFTGFVNHEKLPEVYRQFDVFAALSLQESFGVAVLEASACELPVVVSNAGGLPEVVENGVTGLVVPVRNVNAAANALEKLLSDEDLKITMGKQGRKRVLEKYNWETNAKRMTEIYDELLTKYLNTNEVFI